MTTRKTLLFVLAIALVLGGLPLAAQDDQINMTMWVRSIPFQTQALVDEWNANNDSQIELTVIPSGEFVTKMGAAIAAGEPPDIASIDLIYTPAFAAAGQLVDITDFVRELPYADTLTPAHMELGMYEGRNYAVPTGVDGSFIVYNIDLFEQAGLDPDNPPSTWDEMLDAMRAIDALGDDIYGYWFSMNCAGCNAFTFLPFIWASGGDVLSDDYAEATITTDPIVRDALAFYNTIWEEGLVPEGASIDNGSNFVSAFTGGNIGMAGMGNFAIPLFTNDHPDLNFDVFHIPGQRRRRGFLWRRRCHRDRERQRPCRRSLALHRMDDERRSANRNLCRQRADSRSPRTGRQPLLRGRRAPNDGRQRLGCGLHALHHRLQ